MFHSSEDFCSASTSGTGYVPNYFNFESEEYVITDGVDSTL